MNTPDNNPYPNPDPNQSKNEHGDGSVLAGFFIGWGLMIIGPVVTWLIAALAQNLISYQMLYSGVAYSFIYTVLGSLPLIMLIVAMIWFGKKGKSKTVKGIAAAIGSLIALALLLIAACFGIFSMR